MQSQIRRFIVETKGQDVVEYGLLVALVVLGSVAIWNGIAATLGLNYRGYDSSLWNLYMKAPGT